MEDTYPCLRCVFCNALFGTLRAANFHLDHYLPEYCAAYATDLAVLCAANHPVPAIREFRRKAPRKRFIGWRRPAALPLDGTTWAFIVPVASEEEAQAVLHRGLKPASWWMKRLCEPSSPEPPIPPTPPTVIVNNSVTLNRVAQVQRRGSQSVMRGHAGSSAGIVTPPEHRRRPRRRVTFTPSPFMAPAPPAPLGTLSVKVFGRTYDVALTRGMSVRDAIALAPLRLEPEMVGLAGEDGGPAWGAKEWEGVKRAVGVCGRGEAWVVVVG